MFDFQEDLLTIEYEAICRYCYLGTVLVYFRNLYAEAVESCHSQFLAEVRQFSGHFVGKIDLDEFVSNLQTAWVHHLRFSMEMKARSF